ncbi:uncharacterized protein [Fopius arisanus]|uniref:Peptidase S1 domain-containing protein n=1 Tax=Fopius arisanus TaxID=64838 RepID=A0A9R1TJI2_9HYME|nr:PREDICTED: uncharacterized protein LOC105270898 [Fopius arisanus]
MVSGFLILLLTTVAILPEVKSVAKLAEPGEFPFIAIITANNNVTTFGVLISANEVVAASINIPIPPQIITIQFGCIFLNNCNTPKFLVERLEMDRRVNIFRMKLSNNTHHIAPIPRGPSQNYDSYSCKFVGSDLNSRRILSLDVIPINKDDCLKVGMTIFPDQQCFEDPSLSHEFNWGDVGGPVICHGFLIGLLSANSRLTQNIQFMYDLTRRRRQSKEFLRMPYRILG